MSNAYVTRTGIGSEAGSTDLSLKLNEWLERSGPNGLFRTCGNCRHMLHAPHQPTCTKFQSIPPVDVIMAGCDAHVDEAEPPFDP